MSQFLVIGRDDPSPEGPRRRLTYQNEHRQGLKTLVDGGHLLLAGPLIDDSGTAIGSVLVMEFEARTNLDEWIITEPYVAGRVWIEIEVTPMRVTVPPSQPRD